MKPYQPVPVEAARAIAERYAKSVVIIFAHDPEYSHLHTATYGRTPEEKAWAAQGGEIATKALGAVTELATNFEDYRLTQAKNLLAALKVAVEIIRAWHGTKIRRLPQGDEAAAWKIYLEKSPEMEPIRIAIKTAEEFLGGVQ